MVELFQKLAESRDSVSGRRPQTAKLPYHTEELRKGESNKTLRGSVLERGSPAIEGSPKRMLPLFNYGSSMISNGFTPPTAAVYSSYSGSLSGVMKNVIPFASASAKRYLSSTSNDQSVISATVSFGRLRQ